MALSDINKLAKSDQEAAKEALKTGDWRGVSTAGMRVLADRPYDTSDVLSTQAERAATSTIRGIAKLLGATVDDNLEEEQKSRAMFHTNPVASWTSYIGGSILDPLNLVPLTKVKTAGDALLKLGAFGGVTGFIEPVYDEFNDSRLQNTLVGAGTLGLFGAGLTGLVNKIAGKSVQEVEQVLTSQATDSLNAATTSPSFAGPKPKLKSRPATVQDPLTPEAMFGQEAVGSFDTAFVPPKFERIHGSPTPGFSGKGAVNFESDLDKAFYIIAKEEGQRSLADAKFLDFVMKNTGLSEAASRAEGKKIVNVVAQELKDVANSSEKLIPTTWKPALTKAPRPTRPSIEQTAKNAQDLSDSPKLSSQLFNEPIVHNGSPLVFNSDIDKAAMAVNKNSPNKKEYFDYIKNTFGINEQQTQKIIDDISFEVLQKINKTKLTEGKTLGEIPVKLSDTADNIINPVFKHMDDESRYVYNYSNFITNAEGKANFKLDAGFKQFMNQMRQIFPDIKVNEAIATAQGYQRLMDNLKLDKGAKFTSTNIRDFAKNRNGNLDAFIASVKRGDLDGCWS